MKDLGRWLISLMALPCPRNMLSSAALLSLLAASSAISAPLPSSHDNALEQLLSRAGGGQYLVVVPFARIVAVRQIDAAGDAEKEGQGFENFVDSVLAVARAYAAQSVRAGELAP